MTQEKQPLPQRHIDKLLQFNEVANDIINSSYVKELQQKQLGMNYSWEKNKDTGELEFSYTTANHDVDITKSFLLSLRLIIQNNEPTSLERIEKLYDEMPIANEYKIVYRRLRKVFNEYLDEPGTTLIEGRPSRREIYDTIIYGQYAHKNSGKKQVIQKWREEKGDWDMAYFEFERTLHDFVYIVKLIARLNARVMKDYPAKSFST